MHMLAVLIVLIGSVAAAYNVTNRLSLDCEPQFYSLDLNTFVEKPGAPFEGNVKIDIKCKKRTKDIELNSKGLILAETKLRNKKTNKPFTVRLQQLPELERIKLQLNYALLAGETYMIDIVFSGRLSEDNLGFYRSSYTVWGTQNSQGLAATQFRPTHARQAFPCFDDPMFKTPFAIRLGHHKGFKALSNMPVQDVRNHEKLTNFVWTKFMQSIPMPTHLLAFSLHKFGNRSSSTEPPSSVQFNTWARPNAMNQTYYAADVSPKLLRLYEQFLNMSYPLSKIDQLALPDFATQAASQWGLHTFAESHILYEQQQSSLLNKQTVANTIAKQLVRQWFGNLVSINWWQDDWLMEAFSVYLAGFGVKKVEPSWNFLEQRTIDHEFRIFELDAHVYTKAVVNEISSDKQIWAAFEPLSATKGTVLLGMLHRLVNKDVMMASLRTYLIKYANSTATELNFWQTVQMQADTASSLPKGVDLAKVMNSWTQQKGYPLLNVSRNYENNTALVTQQRFFITPLQSNDTQEVLSSKNGSYCWWVPLSYTSRSAADFNHMVPRNWLTCHGDQSEPVQLDNITAEDWLLLNIRLSALYRVNYDVHNWLLLNQTLHSADYESIDKLNRAQLVNDALSLAWNGILSYDLSLSLIGYLQQERENVVWKTALRSFERLNNILKYTTSYLVFKTFMRNLITIPYQKLVENQHNKEPSSTLLRMVIGRLACQFELNACVQLARNEFAKIRRLSGKAEPKTDSGASNGTETQLLPVEMRETVFCASVRYGTDTEWLQLSNMYTHSNVASEQGIMLAALACSRDVVSLEKVLKWSFGGKNIRKHVGKRAFKAVVRNPLGYLLAKKFVNENVALIRDFCRNSTGTLVQVIRPLFEEVSTEQDLQYFSEYMSNNFQDLHGIKRQSKLLLELGQDNIIWRNTKLFDFLQAIKNLSPPEETEE